jgi:hypothetical protein
MVCSEMTAYIAEESQCFMLLQVGCLPRRSLPSSGGRTGVAHWCPGGPPLRASQGGPPPAIEGIPSYAPSQIRLTEKGFRQMYAG